MKKLFIFFLPLFFFILLPNSGFTQSSLKVGALIPFTGRWGDSGREFAKGMVDAGRWVNQRGGIYGSKLEILLMDDTGQPAETIAGYRKLNETDRILLLYIYSMETGLALLSHFSFNRIPALVSSFPSHLANPEKYPYVFSITPTPLDQSKIAMTFISERSGIKGRKPKIVFVGSSDHLGQHFLSEAKEYAKGLGLDIGPDIWTTHMSQSSDSSIKSALSPLLTMNAYNPDFAYLSLTSKEAYSVLQEAKRLDLKTKWVCNMRAFDETLVPFDGVYGVQPISPFGEDVPGMVDIKEAHQKWHPYDTHTLSYVEAWVTVQAMAGVLGRSLQEHGFSRERVKVAFEGLKDFVMGGLIPPLTITAKDHRPSVESRVLHIKEGKILRYTGFISIGR